MKLKGQISSRRVWLNDQELFPEQSQKVSNHSPDGFNWGYGGSGPAQLALAICLYYLNERNALTIYQQYKWKFIAVLPQSDFEVDIADDPLEFVKQALGINKEKEKKCEYEFSTNQFLEEILCDNCIHGRRLECEGSPPCEAYLELEKFM